jgi:glucose/arabinose dehydrogenase
LIVRRTLLAAAVAALACASPAVAAPSGAPTQIATGLGAPWEVVPTGGGRVLVVQRDAGVSVVQDDVPGTTIFARPATTAKVLGLVLAPDYATSRHLYLYLTENPDQSGAKNGDEYSRIVRLTDNGTSLDSPVTILDQGTAGIGSDLNHDGGRMVFGPDGKLYVTTGDIHQPSRPRDKQNLNGKILRLNPDGTPPADNPFFAEGGNARFVWSYGHRHPQGLVFDAAGRLWETEHGPTGEPGAPAGATNGNDELNLIVRGGDYGWPAVAGPQTLAGTIPPLVYSGPAPAWAPGDLELGSDGLLYAPALWGQHVHVFETDGNGCVLRHGRIYGGQRYRAAVADGSNLWLTTDTNPMKLLRVPLVPGTAGITWDAGPAPRACPPAPSPPVGGGGLATLPAASPAPAPAPPSAAVARAAVHLTTAVKTVGLRKLLKAGAVDVRVGGLGPGRVSVRFSLVRKGHRAVTVAIGRAVSRNRSTMTVRTKLTPTGRRALRGLRTARFRVRIAFAPEGGTKVIRNASVTAKR